MDERPRVIRVNHPACHAVDLSHSYPVVTIQGTYGRTVRRLLSDGPLILIEHDVDPEPAVIEEVWKDGGEDVLAVRYWLYPVTTGLKHNVCAHRVAPLISYAGDERADWLCEPGKVKLKYFGLGCTYLPSAVRDVMQDDWDYPALDWQVSKAWWQAGGKAYAVPQWAEHHHR